MNSDLPIIKVTNKSLTDKTVNDLNKLSAMLFQKNMTGGAKKRKSKTRKLKKSKYY